MLCHCTTVLLFYCCAVANSSRWTLATQPRGAGALLNCCRQRGASSLPPMHHLNTALYTELCALCHHHMVDDRAQRPTLYSISRKLFSHTNTGLMASRRLVPIHNLLRVSSLLLSSHPSHFMIFTALQNAVCCSTYAQQPWRRGLIHARATAME